MDIVSGFNEKPKIKMAWRAMWFGLSALIVPFLWGFLGTIIRPILDPASLEGRESFDLGNNLGIGAVIVSLIFVFMAARKCVVAYKQGERSWVLWAGAALSLVVGSFWVIMIAGELIYPH